MQLTDRALLIALVKVVMMPNIRYRYTFKQIMGTAWSTGSTRSSTRSTPAIGARVVATFALVPMVIETATFSIVLFVGTARDKRGCRVGI